MIRSLFVIGLPSLVHVYVIDCGFPSADNGILTCSPSVPLATLDGGSLNFGGSKQKKMFFYKYYCRVFQRFFFYK